MNTNRKEPMRTIERAEREVQAAIERVRRCAEAKDDARHGRAGPLDVPASAGLGRAVTALSLARLGLAPRHTNTMARDSRWIRKRVVAGFENPAPMTRRHSLRSPHGDPDGAKSLATRAEADAPDVTSEPSHPGAAEERHGRPARRLRESRDLARRRQGDGRE